MSSSGKKYYYNSKTEVSQWEKPREWIERESRTSSKDSRDRGDSHRDKDRDREYRDKDVRDREYRDKDRGGGGSYSNSRSHSNTRSRWPTHDSTEKRRRGEENADMDISPGDSTPTSETSYSHSSTPSAVAGHTQSSSSTHAAGGHHNNNSSVVTTNNNNNNSNDGPILLASPSLPRMASGNSSSGASVSVLSNSNNHSSHRSSLQSSPKLGSVQVTGNGQGDMLLQQQHNSNTPGPPPGSGSGGGGGGVGGSPPVTLAGLPKILSQITGNKQIEQNDLNPQKALQTINNALARQHSVSQLSGGNVDRSLNSPLYTSPHYNPSSLSQLSYRNSDLSNSMGPGDAGPPTPTQEMDLGETRRCESTFNLFWFFFKSHTVTST